MTNLVRLTAAVNRVEVADPAGCFAHMREQLPDLLAEAPDLILFPRFALSSPSCGSLFGNALLLSQAREQLENLAALLRGYHGFVLIGLPVSCGGKVLDVMAVLSQGQLLGLLPGDGALAAELGEADGALLPMDTVFACGNLRFTVACCEADSLAGTIANRVQTGCDLVLLPSYHPAKAGRLTETRQLLAGLSKSFGVAIAAVNGGVGDTSSPHCYSGYALLYECGTLLGEALDGEEPFALTADFDTTIIQARRSRQPSKKPAFTGPVWQGLREELLRPVERNPYLPTEPAAQREYLLELFSLQAQSLAARLRNTGIDRVVIGVSGGLDSTLALLVAAKAFDSLSIPRRNLIGVTMPGFGTTDRTYFNALSLLEALGATSRDISIRAAVSQHFEDIGHNPAERTVVYENAQARERAQILLDIANAVGGLVVGTGDLTEEALGWSTFAGDQIANYNVNTCLTKGMVRRVVALIAKEGLLAGVGELLPDILDTPVSPELLPPGEDGEITQRSEEILGPYEIHDFFLYYLVRYQMAPRQIFTYAQAAFGEDYTSKYLEERLRLFLRRFLTGQFKRSCAPDAAAITEVNLLGVDFAIPSDLSPSMLLGDLDGML